MATSTLKNTLAASQVTAIPGSTLNGLANNGIAVGPAVNWSQGQTPQDGYAWGRVQLAFKFQVAPTVNTGFAIWFCKSQDGGTTYEDTNPPCRQPDLVLPATTYAASAGDTNAHSPSLDVLIPVGYWKAALKSDGTGQSLTANNTDNVLTVTPLTQQMV